MKASQVQEIQVGEERAVVVPLVIWQRLMNLIEEVEDEILYDQIKADPDDAVIEHDDVCRMLGRSPLKYLRIKAGMTQARLSAKTGISQSFIAKVETNQKKLSDSSRKRIAKALNVRESKLDY